MRGTRGGNLFLAFDYGLCGRVFLLRSRIAGTNWPGACRCAFGESERPSLVRPSPAESAGTLQFRLTDRAHTMNSGIRLRRRLRFFDCTLAAYHDLSRNFRSSSRISQERLEEIRSPPAGAVSTSALRTNCARGGAPGVPPGLSLSGIRSGAEHVGHGNFVANIRLLALHELAAGGADEFQFAHNCSFGDVFLEHPPEKPTAQGSNYCFQSLRLQGERKLKVLDMNRDNVVDSVTMPTRIGRSRRR